MGGKHLNVLDINDKKLLQKLSQCVQKGKTVLLQDVLETLDPSLDHLLNKSIIKIGNDLTIKLGDGEITYNPKFQLYITTRMSNPHYTPEVSTKVNVINFSIKEQGLEEQCLGIVVQEEQPALEQNKNQLIEKIENGQNELKRLEDDILTRLQESKISLLENVALIQALQTAKETQENVQQGLESSGNAMKKINETRDSFRPCGRIAAALFFVLLDLHKINPMYQFSLAWYREIFKMSIADAKQNNAQSDQKIATIIKCHIRNVYYYTCRSLFERHKLLLAFQLAIKMKQSAGEVDQEEYLFFLRGAVGLADKSIALARPNADWIQEAAWNNLIELDQVLPAFANVCQAIQLSTKEWKNWFSSKKPEPEEA
jgi:dynein heavy chain